MSWVMGNGMCKGRCRNCGVSVLNVTSITSEAECENACNSDENCIGISMSSYHCILHGNVPQSHSLLDFYEPVGAGLCIGTV